MAASAAAAAAAMAAPAMVEDRRVTRRDCDSHLDRRCRRCRHRCADLCIGSLKRELASSRLDCSDHFGTDATPKALAL